MFDQVGGLSLLALRSQQTRLSNYYAVATCAWLVYDHLLTLPLEIRCMWHAPFRGTSLLFYINRYGALALRLLVVAQGTADISPLSSEEAADSLRGAAARDRSAISAPPNRPDSHPFSPRIRHLGLTKSSSVARVSDRDVTGRGCHVHILHGRRDRLGARRPDHRLHDIYRVVSGRHRCSDTQSSPRPSRSTSSCSPSP
ncbi:hypothetical protein PsYK624_011380 [Phanerochaete sordida]|uniref:DUF6533 domain-containing protein n=1 Tax=Phanerochaete sordida TaxID=48140 RepID=A0A9P3L7H1_9APHY|nr:hypothetical protein PsYK624_011380 [Phanerochaete sordida]